MRTIWAQNSLDCILQSDLSAVKMFHAAKASQYPYISNYIAQFRPQKSKLRFFRSSITLFTGGFYNVYISFLLSDLDTAV